MRTKESKLCIVLVMMLLILIIPACSFPGKNDRSRQDTSDDAGGKDLNPFQTAGSGAVSNIENVRGATVRIVAEGTFIDPEFGLMVNSAGSGSGFIIDPTGIVVTNNHVVTGAALLRVYVEGEDTPRNAKILGVSECSDLAVIDIDGDGFPYLTWHEGEVYPGLEVYSAGFPLGDPEFTLTKGIVSKARAEGESSWASVDFVLEHDATINPGNSGGPLIDDRGRVVGVNYATSLIAVNQFFAIKTDTALPVIERLREGEDVDSIGVNGVAVLDGATQLSGIWVSSVKSGSPADETGIQAGDIISSLEGLIIATDGTMSDYCDVIRSHSAADALSIEILRYETSEFLEGQINGRPLKATVSFAGQFGDGSNETSAVGYSSYVMVTDDTSAIQVEIPVDWYDVDGSEWVENDQIIGASIWAAPDLTGFTETWATPGVIFDVTTDLERLGGYASFLDYLSSDFSDSCAFDGRYDYQDSLYMGMYDRYTNCGGTGTSYLILTAVPVADPQAFLLKVEVQVVSDADWEALDHIINTFQVVGMLPTSFFSRQYGAGTNGAAYSGYQFVTDDYASIQVEIPNEWIEIDGSTWVDVDSGDVMGAAIWAAPNLENFSTFWSTPGMIFQVSDDLARLGGYVQLLDILRESYIGQCELAGRVDYEDALYRGKYDKFEKCGGSGGSEYLILSAISKDDQFAYLILVQVVIVTDADWDALDHILNSFEVIGGLP